MSNVYSIDTLAVALRKMNKNIVMCGVGGQGTVLASKLIASAAMKQDIDVKSAETIGMAHRGGSVVSFLKIGSGIYSPIVGEREADIIIGFEPAEVVRALGYLKPDGAVICSTRPVVPVSAMVGGPEYRYEEIIDYLKR